MNLKFEKYFWKNGYKKIIGLDEAGRGPLAGPVTAGAVIILKPKNIKILLKDKNFQEVLKLANDSKKLSEKHREKIFTLIKKCPFIQFSYSSVNEKIIDKINIEQATFKAMKNCIKKLSSSIKNTILLIDGNRIIDHHLKIPQKSIIKGDGKVFSIALASIVAKVTRDRLMKRLAKKYPRYHFEIHKGYPTKLHRKLLKKYGPSQIHRKSYKLL
jgi:ribonuclease HII